jgi:hypothetical protein
VTVDGEQNPMADAEAQLYRRIQELRSQARGEHEPGSARGEPSAAPPDLRTLLARAEGHVDDLRATAAALEQTLPDRLERAVERALDDHGSSRRLDDLRRTLAEITGQIDRVSRDLLAERLGRVEDLELVVELISAGMASLRQDVAGLAAEVSGVSGGVSNVIEKLDQPMHVTVERPRPQAGVRDLFRPTEAESAGPRSSS